MTFDEFITTTTDKQITFPNCPDGSCMTLMHKYIVQVLGLENPDILAQPTAAEVFTNFGSVTGNEYFEKIDNSPEGVPTTGDILFFGGDLPGSEGAGHVCLVISGDTNSIASFDANFPTGTLPHQELHDYAHVLGWLHPKTKTEEAATTVEAPADNTYKGLDLTNVESVKAAIDTWYDVTQGVYVRKTDLLPLTEKLGLPQEASLPDIEASATALQDKANTPPTLAQISQSDKENILAVVEAHLLHLKEKLGL